MKTHINNPFSARVYVNFNEHYTHMIHLYQGKSYHVDVTSSYNLKQSYVSSLIVIILMW